ncbi:MAG: small GTP-binding protein, partial [Mariniblastus sp.]
MKISQAFSGIFLVVIAACLGFALIYLPGWVISNFELASGLGLGWAYLIAVGLGAILLSGSAIWTVWKLWGASILKKRRRTRRDKNPSELSLGQRDLEINENIEQIERYAADAKDGSQLKSQLDPLLKEIQDKREAQTLEIVAFGTISSGKSSVLNLLAGRDVFATDVRGGTTVTRNEIPWPGVDKVTLVDTPGLGEIDGPTHVNIAADSAKDADIVIVVVDGPLRESEHNLLARLGEMEKRVIICLNKSDWYSQTDRDKLTGQIFRQTGDFVHQADIVCIQAQAGQRTRRKVLADGSEVDESVVIDPNIDPLAKRMMQIVNRDGKDLLMANLLL